MKRGERIAGGNARRVLVVDDEPDIRELLELTLVKMGLAVDTAGSVGEAQERLKNARFDLCITDMRLPDGEGLDLVRHIAGLAHGPDRRALAEQRLGIVRRLQALGQRKRRFHP